MIGVVQIFREKDETKKAEMTKTFQTEGIPNAMKMFEKLLSANGGKFLVGNEVKKIYWLRAESCKSELCKKLRK